MAERSTAAVDVADTGGDQPPTAEEAETTTDGVESQDEPDAGAETGARAEGAPAEGGEAAPEVEPPELHSGHKLARRYRLEECITRLDGFSSWRAVDEKLRRAVGVDVLPADHPRARSVLAAARSAALLGDPRFVQVLDAVEENDLVYVVHEWLPDAAELTTTLTSGPFEPYDAYQLVSQVSQAMAAAHREGLAHLRLTPGSVLRTDSGQYRIRGLAVMAALRGISSDHPQRADTEAIGALLYAALTQRWPYEGDAYGLSGLPRGVGLLAPDQVRAGVHRGLSELAMRALVNDGATPLRQEQPCTTPEELVKAITAIPRIRPPEPSFATPTYRPAAYQPSGYPHSSATGATPDHPMPALPPPPLHSRTGTALKWTVSALLIVALGLGSWQLADTLIDRDGSEEPEASQSESGEKRRPAPVKPLPIQEVVEFSPLGSPVAADRVRNVFDGDVSTAWVTPQYKGYPKFGNLQNRQQGSGLIVDLGDVKNVSRIEVDLYRSGQTVEVLAAEPSASGPATLDDFPQRITRPETSGGTLEATLDKPVQSRYVLVRITELPPDGSPNLFRGGVSEIVVRG